MTNKMEKVFLKYDVDRIGNVKNIKTGRSIASQTTHRGYLRANLYINGKTKGFYVHRLVGYKYLSNENNSPFINHKDGNKLNNCHSNLEWVTRSQNVQHGLRTKLIPSGESSVKSKLKESDVLFIREMAKEKLINQLEMSRLFNVSHSAVNLIVNNKCWKHI